MALVAFRHETLGFVASYRVEIDPEIPTSGVWGVPAFEFGSHGNDAVKVLVEPQAGHAWIASFALDNRLENGIFGAPGESQFVVLTGTAGYLFRADDPGSGSKLGMWPARAAFRPRGQKLLLIGSFTDVVAIDPAGIRWTTARLFLDALDFVDHPAGSIVVRGRPDFVPADSRELVLDPQTGRVVG